MSEPDTTDSEPARGLPPSRDELPLVGSLREYRSDPLDFYSRTAEEFGPVARFSLLGSDFIQLSEPEHIEHVLVRNNQAYRKGQQFRDLMGPLIGNGLLLSEGDFWRSQRRTVEPAFHPDQLEQYSTVIAECVERRLSELPTDEPVDVYDEMMGITAEAAAKLLFDYDIRSHEGDLDEALEIAMDHAVRSLWRPVDVPSWLPTPGNRAYQDALDTIDHIASDIIDQHQTADSDRNAVSMLLEADADREAIRDEVFTLLLAGHETTTLAITYTLQLLAETPAAVETLRAEVDEVLDGGRPTIDDVSELSYTTKALREGMRVYPPVYSMLREPTEDDVVDGYLIPEGSTVMLQQWVVHRDPSLYEDPAAFRPERWTDEFEASLPTFAYFPFGGGPRRCIGEHLAMLVAKIVLATLFRDRTVETHVDDISFEPSLSLRPGQRIDMTLRPR